MKVGNNEPCPCGSGKKFKKCHKGAMVTHKSERFIISVREDNILYKIFAIRFYENRTKNIAGMQVYFPYTKKGKGLLSLVTMPANVIRKDKLSLKEGGKVTSHNVKYSHWADGTVHFSGDEKIYKTHNKKSFTLDSSAGHLFTVQMKGLQGFEEKKDKKKNDKKQYDLDIDVGTKTTSSIKMTGWWYDASVIHTFGNAVPNTYMFKTDKGDLYTCFALEAPVGHMLSNKVLLLCFKLEPFMTKEKESHILFLGGFDTKDIWKDITKDYHFLSLKYPVRNYNKMLIEIGSADYSPDQEISI